MTGAADVTIILVVMARRRPFSLVFDPQVRRHLRGIPAKHHSLIQAAIREQLLFEPESETRNRKPLQQPAALGADWEIRFGSANRFRVLYAVDFERHEVLVLAVGVKEGNRFLIRGEEVEL